jgi:beta-lactamase class A
MTGAASMRPLVAVTFAAAFAGAAALPRAVAAQPRPSADTATLHRTLDSLVDRHRGTVGYAVRNIETGEHLARRGDEPFPTQSLIKVAILVTLFDLVERGQLSLTDKLTLLRIDKVGGSGQLQYLHDGAEITVADAAWLMITLSDNTATNLLLDRIAMRRVWERMDSLGLRRTRVHHKSFLRTYTSVAPDSSLKYGLGVSTPNESVRLFELLATGRAVNPRADSAMLRILGNTEDRTLLQRFIEGVPSAHKTGSGDSSRTECALWRLPDRVVACVFTNSNADTRWVQETEPQLLMGRMGLAIVRAWRRQQGR